MKIAEALILRADYQRRIEQLHHRLRLSAQFQEGDKPAEDPQKLLAELDEVSRALVTMIQRINRTNAATRLSENRSISDAIAERDNLLKQQGIYRSLADASTVTQSRLSRTEIKFVSALKPAEMLAKADDYARAYRELDTRLQEANWLTELLD